MERIRNFLNRLFPKGSAMRHVSILAGGTTIAQGINIAIMPVLSRIYSPADFGVMAVFVSVTSILMELSGFRYHLAIPLPKHERYAKALVVLSFILQAVFVVFISAVFLVFGKPFLGKISMDALVPYRYLIPVGVAGMGAYIALTQWAIREKLFHTIARTKVTQSVSGILTKVILGLLGIRPFGLLLGSIIGQAGGITTLARSLVKNKGIPKPPLEDIKRVALRYRKFPMYSTWGGVLNTLRRQIMPVLLIVLYNPQIAGWFAMAQNLLQIPVVFVGEAIGQVFLQRASIAKHEGDLAGVSLRFFAILIQTGSTIVLVISIFSPWIFPVLLGEKWRSAGEISQVLALYFSINFAYSPLSRLFSITDRQNVILFVEISNFIVVILTLFITSKVLSVLLVFFAVNLVDLVFSLGLIVYLLSKVGNSLSEIVAPLKKFYMLPVAIYLTALLLGGVLK